MLSQPILKLFAHHNTAEFENMPLEKRPPITSEHWRLLFLIGGKHPSKFFPLKDYSPTQPLDTPTYKNILAAGCKRSTLRDLIRWDLIRGVVIDNGNDIKYTLTSTAKTLYKAHKVAGKYREEAHFYSGLEEEGEHQFYQIWCLATYEETLTQQSNAHAVKESFEELDKELKSSNCVVELWQHYSASGGLVGHMYGFAFRVLYDTGWYTPAYALAAEAQAWLKEFTILNDDHYNGLVEKANQDNLKEIWESIAKRYDVEPTDITQLPAETMDKLRAEMAKLNPNWDENMDDKGCYPEDEMLIAAHRVGLINLDDNVPSRQDVILWVAHSIQRRPDVKPEHRDAGILQFANKVIRPLWWKHMDTVNRDGEAFKRLTLTILGYTQVPFPPQK